MIEVLFSVEALIEGEAGLNSYALLCIPTFDLICLSRVRKINGLSLAQQKQILQLQPERTQQLEMTSEVIRTFCEALRITTWSFPS